MPTLVSRGPSWLCRARTVASSHRATTRGVASTGTLPDFNAIAVSWSPTTRSTSADSPGFTVTGAGYGEARVSGHFPPRGNRCVRRVDYGSHESAEEPGHPAEPVVSVD